MSRKIGDTEWEEHESYGLVSFARIGGDPGRLFGSALKSHSVFIQLRVSKGMRAYEYGHPRYFASMRGDIVEVNLSAAQFAELLTTMNVGLGVPCTIGRLQGKPVAPPPEDPNSEGEKVRLAFKDDMSELRETFLKDKQVVAEIMAKKSLTQLDRKTVMEALARVDRFLGGNAEFMLTQFEESTEKVVVAAKAEVDALITHNIVTEGLRALQCKIAEPQAPELPEGTEGAGTEGT